MLLRAPFLGREYPATRESYSRARAHCVTLTTSTNLASSDLQPSTVMMSPEVGWLTERQGPAVGVMPVLIPLKPPGTSEESSVSLRRVFVLSQTYSLSKPSLVWAMHLYWILDTISFKSGSFMEWAAILPTSAAVE